MSIKGGETYEKIQNEEIDIDNPISSPPVVYVANFACHLGSHS